MSKFKKQFKKLSGWDIPQHTVNEYKERVIDDPMLKRKYTAIDIERRIRSALNQATEETKLDTAVAYKTQFTRKGSEYYVVARIDQKPKLIVSIWTEEIYQNYLEGITSKGYSIYEHRRG